MDDEDQIPEPSSDAPIKLLGPSVAEPSPPPRPSGGEVACDADVEEGLGCGMESGLDDESDDEGEGENGDLQKTDQQDATAGTNDEQKSEAGAQEKTLKKPDKIIPCPRCASMDTKFCYFNNYNVNQPRYFCRKCQRYWTSGGTMRNLPVGAGRRKSKSSAPQRQQMEVPRDFQTVSARGSNGVVAHNGSVLQVSSPKGVEKASRLNGLCKPKELKIWSSHETVVDGSRSGSAGSGSNIENEGQATAPGYQSFQPHMLCFPAPLWPPFPFNPAQYNCPLPSPISYRPGFPMPFYPMYMGCVPGAWNLLLSAHPSSPSLQSEPKSPTLGKHSRDDIDNAAKPGNTEAGERPKEEYPKPSIWVPKTVRIDDLEEAAKSSMWATLGIKNDNILQSNSKGHLNLFSSLAVETERSRPVSSTSSALLANPAALSRSMNFHESSST